jgi:hypothetical protein
MWINIQKHTYSTVTHKAKAIPLVLYIRYTPSTITYNRRYIQKGKTIQGSVQDAVVGFVDSLE